MDLGSSIWSRRHHFIRTRPLHSPLLNHLLFGLLAAYVLVYMPVCSYIPPSNYQMHHAYRRR